MRSNSVKWNKFLNGEIPFIVLGNVLYQTNVGDRYRTYLPNKGKDPISVLCRRIGTVPEALREKLPNSGFHLKCVGPFKL